MEYTAEQYLERIENKNVKHNNCYTRKELIRFAEKYAKQLAIQRVSQQREPLLAYHRYLTEELSLDLHELWVDKHLEANNCG